MAGRNGGDENRQGNGQDRCPEHSRRLARQILQGLPREMEADAVPGDAQAQFAPAFGPLEGGTARKAQAGGHQDSAEHERNGQARRLEDKPDGHSRE